MSFDEYVNHISQKYRLAVAISVIKTKPDDLSIEDFLTQLQRKINMESDPNETVCSDDFNFDDDTMENQQLLSEEVNNVNKIDFESTEKLIQPENEDSLMSQTILGDFAIEDIGRHESDVQKETSVIGDTLKLLKATGGMDDQDSSQLTFCESQGTMVNNPTTYCYRTEDGYVMTTPETNIDPQVTELYTLHGFTQDYTHVSQTQEEQFFISDKFIRNVDLKDNMLQGNKIVVTNKECIDPNKTVPIDNKNINTDVTQHTFENADVHEIEECNEMLVEEETDNDDMLTVKVPFKVLEELNKVKSYLYKKDRRNTEGYSTDSGYRSDSQQRRSFKTLSQNTQSPGIWVNQSAHCLFTYLIQAPTTSDDITREISQVLGQLIDRLHEEENYPTFLEELLETVDSLIRDIHEGGHDEHTLLTKDESMHHLNLLNKSKHILRHSIDNITHILEKLHINLSQEELYELTNTSEIENVSYIFHTLEIFLKRYMKFKNASSQSTQNSQDESSLPKRSSLTDLWRKKWNPNYRETSKVHDNLTVCAVKRCSAVLNKIIVECMDGYSLIAYAALQCFNLIQS